MLPKPPPLGATLPGLGGLVVAVGLAVFPQAGHAPVPSLAGLGAISVALYVLGLVGVWPGALAWGLGLLALQYLVSLLVRGPVLDVMAPLYAAGLLLCAELGWLGIEARAGMRPWPGRAFAISALALAGAGLGAVLLLVAAAPLPGSPALTGLGVAAAVSAAGGLAWLAGRARP